MRRSSAPALTSGIVGRATGALGEATEGLTRAVQRRPAAALALILAASGVLHVAVRLVISDSAELDEAEQLLLTQSFAWGYTLQPPLYTWLQQLTFAVFGVNIFALTFLKNLLLLGTQAFLYLAARRMLGSGDLAVGVALSLWLVPQIAWESHRDLTHSVLVTTLSAAAFYVMLELLAKATLGGYVILGVLLGLGALAKHNFVFFVAALVGASLTGAASARRLADRRILLTVLLAGGLVLPHVLWLSGQSHVELAAAAEKLGVQGDGRVVEAVTAGLGRLGWATVRFLGPLLLVWLLLFPRAFSPAAAARVPARRFLERFFLASFGLLVLAVVLFQVTHFKDRWMQPVLFLAPLYAFLRIPGGRPEPARGRALAVVLGVFGLAFLVAPLGQAWVGPWFGIYSRLHIPHVELARQIRAAGFVDGTIVADDVLLGGNLRLAFPAARILTPEVATAVRPRLPGGGTCLVAWRAGQPGGPPRRFGRLVVETLGTPLPLDAVPRVAEAWLRGSIRRTHRIEYVLLPDGLGQCR